MTATRMHWWMPQMTGGEVDRITDVLNANYVNEGPVTAEFERAIAGRLGVKHAVATTSGTSAIFLAVAAVGAGPGDEVIIPDLTFIATANAVRLTGATVVLADIDPHSLNLDVAAVERVITPRTKAIVPVHVSGRGADMAALMALAQRRGIRIVEDSAEAFPSRHDGRMLGTIGDAGCFSFSPNKTITTGQGGMVVTSDDELVTKLRMLKDHGRPVRGTGGDDIHHGIGYNFKLTDLQAAVGMAQLTALDGRLARQKRIYSIYAERLQAVRGLSLPGFDLDGGEQPLWTDALVERRDALVQHLASKGMDCRRFWHPLHTQSGYATSGAALENTSIAARMAVWLPSSFTLTDADVHSVCDEIIAFLGR